MRLYEASGRGTTCVAFSWPFKVQLELKADCPSHVGIF